MYIMCVCVYIYIYKYIMILGLYKVINFCFIILVIVLFDLIFLMQKYSTLCYIFKCGFVSFFHFK